MALNAGDIVFLGYDADNNDVVLATTATIAAGEEIFFTDDEWNGSAFNNTSEQLIRWVVPTELPPGTVLTLDMIRLPAGNSPRGDAEIYIGTEPGPAGSELANLDYLRGGGSIAGGNEQVWIVQGDYNAATGELTPNSAGDTGGFVSVISNDDGGSGPVLTNTGLSPDNGAVIIDGDEDFMIFDPVLALGDRTFDEPPDILRENLLALVGDPSNWTTADGGGNQNPGAGFDFNLGDLSGLPQPFNGQTDVTTLFFLGDQVAFVSAITDTGTATELTTEFNFEPTDLIEIDIISKDIEQGGAVAGEFKREQVIFTRVTVIRDGVSYDLEIEPASQINPSNRAPDAQGDSFFTTLDDVEIPAGLPFGQFTGTLAVSLDESFLDNNGNPVDPVIERLRPDLDTNGDGIADGGPPVTNANFNANTALTGPPIPCFVAGTLLDTPDGPRAVQTLQAGDLVLTQDNGAQPVRWVGQATVRAAGDLAPILIRKGALGTTRDLRVSPQHRIAVNDWRTEVFFGLSQCLVAAKHLCDGRNIVQEPSDTPVTYVHVLFDTHELVRAAGLWSESYFPGSYALGPGGGPVERELRRLFPTRFGTPEDAQPARPILKRFEAALMSGRR